ncbi:MAG: hypothetical protein ABS894_00865 [Aerococcus urinaeequi]
MNIRQEHLDFMEVARNYFEENDDKESYRDAEETFIALRRGVDRNCIEIIPIMPGSLFFENMLERKPKSFQFPPEPAGNPAPNGNSKITKVLTVSGVKIHYVPHEWDGFEYIITPENNRKFEDIYLHCLENRLAEYNFNLWEEVDSE